MIRVVIDTNVWISGIYWKGHPFEIIRKVDRGELKSFFSQETFTEWDDKIKSVGINIGNIDLYFKYKKLLTRKAYFISPVVKIDICRDPTDNKFLEVASAVNAKYLITGDKDLLDLKRFQKAKIISPKQFLNEITLRHL